MKKSNLVSGLACLVFGLICLGAVLSLETRLEGILWGLSGAGIACGVAMISKYFYWSSPKNREVYAERMENEQIEMHDELKVKIRDKAGRYAYTLGLLVISFSMVVFCVLGTLEIIENYRMIVLYLGGYLLFQAIAGIVIFNMLMKRF